MSEGTRGEAHAAVPQKPVEGVSMVYSFDDAKAPSKRRTQYFEMFANRALYNDGWVACTTPPTPPWASSGMIMPLKPTGWPVAPSMRGTEKP